MKIKEVRAQSDSELNSAITDAVKRIFEFRTQAVTDKLEDPSQITKAKRDIARIKTVQRERALAAAKK